MNAIPYGFCNCGCGERTTIATRTWAAKGWVRGQPHRFLRSHNGLGVYHDSRAPKSIDVEPLQRAFLESGLTASEVARRLGWEWNGRPDTTRVRRRLGLVANSETGRCSHVWYRTAVDLARALDVDPFEVGV